jgi:hypothetical protein
MGNRLRDALKFGERSAGNRVPTPSQAFRINRDEYGP